MVRKNRFSRNKIILFFFVFAFILLFFIYKHNLANNPLAYFNIPLAGKKAEERGRPKPTPSSTANPSRLFVTPSNFSPKKGNKYNPINLSPPVGSYTKNHSLQSGPSYKVGSSCWADKQIFTVPNSEELAFTCKINQSGIDITGVNIPGFKMYQYCQIETGQILIWRDHPQDDSSGSLQLINQDGTIIGIAALPILPKQYNKTIESIDPIAITKNGQIYLFVSNWGNRVANDSLKVDLNKGIAEILLQPTYIKEGDRCPQ